MKTPEDNKGYILRISKQLHSQDNRITENPMFCVQGKERIFGADDSDLVAFYSEDQCTTLFSDGPDKEEWARLNDLYDDGYGTLPHGYIKVHYFETWKTVQVCFTEVGCNEYLERNGHNLRHYFGTRIYVDSFNRNPEMVAIREFLLNLTTQT